MRHHDVVPDSGRPVSALATTLGALRGLPAAGAWVWLVAPAALEDLAVAALVLLHVLPGLLVALGTQVGRHG